MVSKPLQAMKANAPMLVTVLGIVMFIRPVCPEKADVSILVTLPSAGIALFLQPAISVLSAVRIRQFPSE